MSAVERAYNEMRQLLVSGEFSPGQRLTEPDLAVRFGVSRTPLREAFRVLEADGLLTLSGRGAVVVAPSVEEIGDLYAFRAILESFAASEAARRNVEGELAPSQVSKLHEYEAAIHGSTGSERRIANVRFHGHIAELSGNAHVRKSLERAWAQISVVSAANLRDPSWDDRASEDHLALISAIESGDAATASAMASRHVLDAAAVYEKSVRGTS